VSVMLTSSRSFTKHKAVSQLTVGRRTWMRTEALAIVEDDRGSARSEWQTDTLGCRARTSAAFLMVELRATAQLLGYSFAPKGEHLPPGRYANPTVRLQGHRLSLKL
jgi:hypothetical protein